MGKLILFKRRLGQKAQKWLKLGSALPSVLIVLLVVVTGVVGYSKFLTAYAPSVPKTVTLSDTQKTVSGRVSVIDGDTIEIHGKRIRLYGIDAPEMGQQCTANGKVYRCGQKAALALSNEIGNLVVECRQKDTDRYGRVVATCLVAGKDINEWMVAEGWALAYRLYSHDYVGQEERAERAQVGLWQGEFTPPWDWRRGSRSERGSYPSQSAPSSPSASHGVVYYQPSDFSGTRYQTITQCQQAKQRAGNVGICVMKSK